MTIEQFSKLFCNALELDPKTNLDMNAFLSTFATWDSLSIVSFASMLDLEYNIILLADQIQSCKTVADLYQQVLKGSRK